MKEFDIELAKAGHPVCTRDGLPARIICFDKKGDLPIVSLIKNKEGIESVGFHTIDGNYDGCIKGGSWDLMMATVKKTGYIQIHEMERFDKEKVLTGGGRIYSSREECIEAIHDEAKPKAIAKVEWEED